MQAGHSIFAHSRAIALRGFARFYINMLLYELQAKKPLKYYTLPALISSAFCLSAARGQLAAAPRVNAYHCFLPDLVGFTSLCCAGPSPGCRKIPNNAWELKI